MNQERVIKAAKAIIDSLHKRGCVSFKGNASLGVDAKLLLALDRALKPRGDVKTFYALVHPNHGSSGASPPRLYGGSSTAVGVSKQVGSETDNFRVVPVTLPIPKYRKARR